MVLVAACGGSQEAVDDPNMGAGPATMPEPATTAAPAETAAPEMTATAEAAVPEAPKEPDLVDWAEKAGNYTSLVGAIKAAGLVETLKGPGPFTVFAPSDEAFKKVKKADMDKWMKPENKETLANVLKHHVAAEKLMAADVVKLDKKTIKTVAGKEMKVAVKGDVVTLDGKAKIVKTDMAASNGVAHEIDTVLPLPK